MTAEAMKAVAMAITWLNVIYSVRGGGGGEGRGETTTASRSRCYCLPPSVRRRQSQSVDGDQLAAPSSLLHGWTDERPTDRPTDPSDCRTTRAEAAAIRGRKEERKEERRQRVCDDQTRWQTQTTTTTTTRVPCRAVPCRALVMRRTNRLLVFFVFFLQGPFPSSLKALSAQDETRLGVLFFASVCLCGWWWWWVMQLPMRRAMRRAIFC